MAFFQLLLQETRALFSSFENDVPERMVTFVYCDGPNAMVAVYEREDGLWQMDR